MCLMRRVAVLLVIALAACGDATGPKFGLSGYWTGVVGTSQQLSMTIIERAGIVSGTGTLTGTPTGTRALTVTGTLINDVVDLTMSSPPVQPFTLHARLFVATDQYNMDGALQGSGFTGETIRLVQFEPPR